MINMNIINFKSGRSEIRIDSASEISAHSTIEDKEEWFVERQTVVVKECVIQHIINIKLDSAC